MWSIEVFTSYGSATADSADLTSEYLVVAFLRSSGGNILPPRFCLSDASRRRHFPSLLQWLQSPAYRCKCDIDGANPEV
jgi:hypothetical protein